MKGYILIWKKKYWEEWFLCISISIEISVERGDEWLKKMEKVFIEYLLGVQCIFIKKSYSCIKYLNM